jgi:hypothetical protein
MQTQLPDIDRNQLDTLPLPSASLVLDLRGITTDDLLEHLRLEIADLANEMQVQHTHHWRYLTHFLSFRILAPLSQQTIQTFQASSNATRQLPSTFQPTNQSPANNQSQQNDPTTFPLIQDRHIIGNIQEHTNNTNEQHDLLRQQIGSLVLEINRLRNNRIAAINNFSESSTPARGSRENTVRVIFLTDASQNDSLQSASLYAATLKAHFNTVTHSQQQPLISTTIVCLNHKSEVNPPGALIHGLRWQNGWQHLDSIIINEQFREDAALINDAQSYLTELLLYVLLIIPPFTFNTALQAKTTSADIQPVPQQQSAGTWVQLPATTYLVGLATLENSVRWGRRWLNYRLTTQAIQQMIQPQGNEAVERQQTHQQAENWLQNWLQQLEEAIPAQVISDIPELKAIVRAEQATHPPIDIFTDPGGSLDIGCTTMRDLRAYLDSLLQTYHQPIGAHTPDTLTDAQQSIAHIEPRIAQWEERDRTISTGLPLSNAVYEARHILSQPPFFQGSKGAIPHAQLQLQELQNVITERQHHTISINISDRQQTLSQRGTTLLQDLDEHLNNLPLLAGRLRLSNLLTILTSALLFLIISVIVFVTIAWLRHTLYIDAKDMLTTLDNLFLVDSSLLAYIFWIILIAAILLIAVAIGRAIIRSNYTSFEKELFFWLALILTLPTGALFSYAFSRLLEGSDTTSVAILAWLAPIPALSIVCLLIALLILIIEGGWFLWWHHHLLNARQRIVTQLQNLHQQNIHDMRQYCAATLGFQLLTHVGLNGKPGQPGPYATHIDQLQTYLQAIAQEADQQQHIAAQRLLINVNEEQPGIATTVHAPWLNLKTRAEYLDVDALVDGYQRIAQRINNDGAELQNFCTTLIDLMSGENTIAIARHQQEQTTSNHISDPTTRFVTTLAGITLQFGLMPETVTSITPLLDRYEAIDGQYLHHHPELRTLIEALNKNVRATTLHPLVENTMKGPTNTRNVPLATTSCAIWSQLLWEEDDQQLDRLLARNDILTKLIEHTNHDTRALMRHLQTRTALFGHPKTTNQPGELRLLIAPSARNRSFCQSLNIASNAIIDFPDIERMVLLAVQHYHAEPLFVPE